MGQHVTLHGRKGLIACIATCHHDQEMHCLMLSCIQGFMVVLLDKVPLVETAQLHRQIWRITVYIFMIALHISVVYLIL